MRNPYDLSRRGFLTTAATLAGGSLLGADALALAREVGLPQAREFLPSYLADTTGNGKPGNLDKKLVKKAMGERRGFDVQRNKDYDYRADIFGRGRVDNADFQAVRKAINYFKGNAADVRPRPVTVGWHYAWYNHANRKPNKQHVWFKDGGYSSRDPRTEELFNDLKNEFGITVDAVSWADPTADKNLNDNFDKGYMRATNGRTRRAALLYESLISLRGKPGKRIDFGKRKNRNRLVDHFRGMARTFVKFRDDSRVKVFTIDGRPVIFIYASHVWGTNVDGTGEQYDYIDQAMEDAIAAFRKVYGTEPFVIGEEMTFVESDRFDLGRQRRSANFDGIFIYHHAANADFIVRGGQNLKAVYVAQVRAAVANSYAARNYTSRFTEKPLIVVPSLAAGFSKVNVPTLHANRTDYADFLKEMIGFHEANYMEPAFGSKGLAEQPSIVSVGSWNEEWEGHAVMPAQFNRTMAPRTQQGFDYVMAIKQAFGWNHYAEKQLDVRF